VRRLVCTHCWRRPPGSESLSQATARSCQATCPIFQLLPALIRRAELLDPSIGCSEHALQEMVDLRREQVEPVDEMMLKRYGATVVRVVAEMVETAG
jgi:hypothetical protein